MSLSIWRGAFGRCTLTATRRPFGSTARCTWPIDAAASGCSSNSRKSRSIGWSELLADHALDVRVRERLDVVLEAAELGDDVGRHDVRPGREQLPELDERRPELVEHLAQVAAAQRSASRRRRVRAAAVEHEPEAVAHRDLGDLAQAADARGLRAGRGHRPQCCTPSGRPVRVLAGERAGDAAVDRDHRAGRGARAVGDEERDRLGDVARPSPRGRAGSARRRSASSSSTGDPVRLGALAAGSPPTRASSRAKIASGLTALARMPCGPPSSAAIRISWTRPGLRDRVGPEAGARRERVLRRDVDEAAADPLLAASAPATRRVSRNGAVRLTSRLRAHSSSASSSSGPVEAMPALRTTASRPP